MGAVYLWAVPALGFPRLGPGACGLGGREMIGLGPLLPIPRGKKGPPCFEQWQSKTEGELEELYPRFKNCNPALRLDTLVQIDADNEPALKKVAEMKRAGILPPTVNYLTWRGVETPLYKAPPGLKSFDVTANRLKLQIRTGPGHYALIPDSVFNGKPYKWAKHLGPADLELVTLPDAALAHLQRLSLKTKAFSSTRECNGFVTEGGLDFQKGGRDNTLYTVARTLYRGGMTPQDAEQVIKILAKNCFPAFPEKDALRKIESAFKEERNLAQEIREWLNVTGPLWTVTECDRELGIVTDRYKANRRVILHRLVTEGVIARVEGKSGTFRLVEREANELDFLNADTGSPQPIQWPFELQRLVDIYPKNLVIVAGAKDAGKTAFMLNVIRNNMDRFPTKYCSSEMGEKELALRLSCFGYPLTSWKFKAYERASNFADIMDPDALNIIDFLEITDNFYLIAGELRKIYEKLRNGIAVIAIQKDEKAELGRGKAFSLEKARMYLTLDSGKDVNELKIVSGKNWAQRGHNPKGKIFKYKLVDGCKFIQA